MNPHLFDQLPDGAFVRQAQLLPYTVPLSSSSLWRLVKAGKFPRPVKISANVTAWRVGEVRAWIAARTAK